MADPDQLRIKFLAQLKRVEQLFADNQLEKVEGLLLEAQVVLNQRKAAMAALLQLWPGNEEHQRTEIRQSCPVQLSSLRS
jgi:hypothetical protein